MSIKENFKNVSILQALIPLVLSIIGIIFIYSAGITSTGNNMNYYIKQLFWMIIGFGLAYAIVNIDYFRFVDTSFYFYLLGIVLLIMTLIFGKTIRGAKSWFGWGGLGIQASEFMKIFYILFFAKYLSNISKDKAIYINRIFFNSLLILLIPLGLILLQPDLGTSIVFVVIFLAMGFMGFENIFYIKHIIILGLYSAFLLILVVLYKYYVYQEGKEIEIISILVSPQFFFSIAVSMFFFSIVFFILDLFIQKNEIIPTVKVIVIHSFLAFSATGIITLILKPYQWRRLLVMINPYFDRQGAGYNIIQSRIAIGSGGLFGKGLFRGTQNVLGFLPEKHTDFIFSIIAEESGFIGAGLIILLFNLYFYQIIKTIMNAKDKEGMLVATGILAMFFTHFVINIGMNLGITPATGLPLPFISYGGSSYLAFIMGAALIFNIYSRRFVH